MEYADEEMRKSKLPVHGPVNEGEVWPQPVRARRTFKYLDGVERLIDMELPFLVDLPNGSCEAVFVTAGKNAGCGVVPILEWCNGRRTVLDREGGNGIFLASHDPRMHAKVYKTVESVPEIYRNNVFWQIFVNLEDSLVGTITSKSKKIVHLYPPHTRFAFLVFPNVSFAHHGHLFLGTQIFSCYFHYVYQFGL